MTYKVIILSGAYVQIEAAVRFVSNVSLEAAQNLYKEIMMGINSLKEFPFRFPHDEKYDVVSLQERKMNIDKGRYSILYHIKEDMVIVEYFIDNRQK